MHHEQLPGMIVQSTHVIMQHHIGIQQTILTLATSFVDCCHILSPACLPVAGGVFCLSPEVKLFNEHLALNDDYTHHRFSQRLYSNQYAVSFPGWLLMHYAMRHPDQIAGGLAV